jgi:hypothetical protein
MITRAQGFVLVHNNVQQATQTDISNLTTKTNKQEVVLPQVCTKKFLLALIFGSLNST